MQLGSRATISARGQVREPRLVLRVPKMKMEDKSFYWTDNGARLPHWIRLSSYQYGIQASSHSFTSAPGGGGGQEKEGN
jgi:hypothetical protein